MAAGRGSTGRLRLLFAVVAAAWYALDQVSKVLATRHLAGEPDVRVLGDVLQLHLTFNPGAAFSTGTGLTPLITLVAVAATVTVLWFSRRIGSPVWAVAMGLLLAGIVGNLTDRVLREPGPFRGHVVDFLMLPNWPVFNVADIGINVAAGLIIIQAVRGVRLDGDRDTVDDEPEDPEAGPVDHDEPAGERAE